jgi:hypothetical protein
MEFFDLIDQAAVTGAVRQLPEPPTTQFDAYLPDVTVPSIDFAIESITDNNKAARFRSYDAPVEIGDGPSLVRTSGEIPALGEGYLVGEYKRLLEEQLRGADISDALLAAALNKVARGFKRIKNRVELARGQVLTTGKFTLSGEGRLHLEADFGVPTSNFVTPGVAWSPSVDISTDIATWAALAEIAPDVMLCGDLALAKILKSEELRNQYGNAYGAPNGLTVAQANQVLVERGLPAIVPVRRTRIEVPDPETGSYVAADTFPRNKIAMFPQGFLGDTKWGTTFEALEMAAASMIEATEAPGLVATVMREGNPGKVFTVVNAVAIPTLENPASLVVATV